MSDRATIVIDCDARLIEARGDVLDFRSFDRPLETHRADIIVNLIMPQLHELMKLSKAELMRRHLVYIREEALK